MKIELNNEDDFSEDWELKVTGSKGEVLDALAYLAEHI